MKYINYYDIVIYNINKMKRRLAMKEEILRLIENNSRIDLHEAAILVGAEEAEVANAIAEMEKEKIICGYYTLIDWDKTSEDRVTALIEVRVTPQRGSGFDDIADRIMKYDEVKAVYLMSGGFDFTVIIEEKTMKEIAQFVTSKLSTLDSILNTATHFVLKKYKDYGTILSDKEERILVTP
jgi:DNA-binding Lrp family transcriptional regulator